MDLNLNTVNNCQPSLLIVIIIIIIMYKFLNNFL